MLLDPSSVRNVLVVKLSALGDVVHATPCFRALRRHLPDARIWLAVDHGHAAVVRHDPNLDGVISHPFFGMGRLARWCRIRRLLYEAAGPRFDLAIDLQGTGRSAVWVYLSRARVKAGRGGLRPGWRAVVRPDPGQHAVRVCAAAVEAVGVPVNDLSPRVYPCPHADREVEQLLTRAGVPPRGFIVVNPFSCWPTKCWPPDRYAELIRRVSSWYGRVVITGGPGEEGQAANLLARLSPNRAVSLVGDLSLSQAICLYARAGLMVSGDTGPLHVADAVGTRVVALFGPTLPERTGPWNQPAAVIRRSRPAGQPSFRTDRTGHHMEAIAVGVVEEAVEEAMRPAAAA